MTCIVCGQAVGFGALLVYLDESDHTVHPTMAHAICLAKMLRALRREVSAFAADLQNLGGATG